MRTCGNYQKEPDLREEENAHSHFDKWEEEHERVWKNLEKILDEFEYDFKRSKEELNDGDEQTQSKSYFNWDIETGNISAA